MSKLSPCSTEGPSRYLYWTKWERKFFWSGTKNATVIMEIDYKMNSDKNGRDYQVTSRLPGHGMLSLRASTLERAKEKADALYAQWCAGMELKIAE